MATLQQLASNGVKSRKHKRRRCVVPALSGGPQRRGVITKVGTTTPKKPNSAKRKFAKVRIMFNGKLVFAHVSGIGPSLVQEFSVVLIEGGNPPDVPGINYTLVRGVLDFISFEEFGRRKRRSKFATPRALDLVKYPIQL